MKEMEDNSVDLVLTDPPYNINLQPQREITKPIMNDNLDEVEFIKFISDFGLESKRILKNDTFFICFCGWPTIPEFRSALDKLFYLKSMPIWVKNNFGIGYYTRPQYEPCLLYFNGKPKILKHPISDVWHFDKLQNPLHSCQKPCEMIEFILKSFTEEGQTIFDPFLGSGTTAVACINTGRNFIGIEKDADYFEIAQRRIKNALEQARLF
jgi:site-specific DNA-methyltransferase (adenine-specific)